MWLDELTLSTVVVHTKDGLSLKGAKRAVHDDCIVLCDVLSLGDDGQSVLKGDIVVPRENVSMMQVVAP